ncbi:MAG: NUDIX domain-containing protein [Parcubacteria group bacterium]|nr:NUDIX domain-containing protein [Parcubacteria group bacterium]
MDLKISKERNKAVPAVYLFLRKGKEILLGRRRGSGYYDGWYSVPAGHVEAGELPIGGLVREMKEELGIDINPKDLILVHTMYRTKHDETGERLDLFFKCKKWFGEVRINEPDKCDDLRWFPIKKLPENMMHHVKTALENSEKRIPYSEPGPVRR